jgi:hypothetical protein
MRLIIINLIITNLITTRLMPGIHRCHFPSAGAEVGAAGTAAGMVEVGTAAGTAEKFVSNGDRIHFFGPRATLYARWCWCLLERLPAGILQQRTMG